ncbi:hypothetical protein SLS53_000736 [Cytospora paraplurivora]|uniref:S-adenosyl-L-methionine-dependent methyltransferase n=1 Tax=Cytospora paraplurivora TaxID=2898453 RepID=A0AAN9YKM3_9PEZI
MRQQARGVHRVFHIHEADEGSNGRDFQDQEPHRRRSYGRQSRTQRNPPLDGTHRRVLRITVNGISLEPGMFVELREALAIGLMLTIGEDSVRSPVGACFVEIKAIWISKNDDQSVFLRGLPYTRNHNLFGRLEKKKNEVCQILEVDDDDDRPEEEQSLVEIKTEQVLRTRTLIMTNKPFPQDGKPRFDPAYNTWQKVRDFAPLTCRWKMRMESKDAAQRKAGRAYGGSLIRLAENDVPKEKHRVSDNKLREDWRGPTGKNPTPYTFGDMFCGAGGVSRGAVMAGLQFPSWPTPSDKRKTELQAIGGLRPGTDLHDVRNARVVNQPPRDGNAPLGETILGGGTQKFQHYSGTRAYTLRELACLQGFPVVHRFEGGSGQIKKQIGNAFAPCVVKVFLTHLRQHLERVDGAQHPRGPPPAPAFRPLPNLSLPSSGPYDRRPRLVKNIGPLDNYNGNLDEDEALELALQESKKTASGARRPATPRGRGNVQQVIDLRDSDDEVKDTPVGGHFAPLIGRLSINSPRTPTRPRHRHVAQLLQPSVELGSRQSSHSATRDLEPRSRSATLDFSPQPASRKRSLDDMHNGAEDQTVKDESPEKRERVDSSEELLTGDEASFMEAFEKKQKSPTSHGHSGSEDDEVWTF